MQGLKEKEGSRGRTEQMWLFQAYSHIIPHNYKGMQSKAVSQGLIPNLAYISKINS